MSRAAEAGQLVVRRHEESRGLLMDTPPSRPVNDGGGRESSVPVKSATERRAMTLTRAAAVDVDDSDSQTSSSCPTTSSSSTSTTFPPGCQLSPTVHTAAQRTVLPQQTIASVSGTAASQFQATSICRVWPLTNVDWQRGDGLQRQTDASTLSPASAPRNRSDDGELVRRNLEHQPAITAVTPRTNRRCVRPHIGSTVARPYDDDGHAVSVDGILTVTADHNVQSRITVYDDVQQLHV